LPAFLALLALIEMVVAIVGASYCCCCSSFGTTDVSVKHGGVPYYYIFEG